MKDDEFYDWEEAYGRWNVRPSVTQRIRLLFRPWKMVLAPYGLLHLDTTVGGRPIYRYKTLDRRVFHLSPKPFDRGLW